MKAVINHIFATMAAVLFAFAAGSVLLGAFRTPDYSPNDAHIYLLDTVGGVIIAFLAAQVGIVVAKSGSFSDRVKQSMGSGKTFTKGLLLATVIVFLVGGTGFVLLWVKPDWIAVPKDGGVLKEAPAYIATQAKTFVGVMLGAFAGLAPNAID